MQAIYQRNEEVKKPRANYRHRDTGERFFATWINDPFITRRSDGSLKESNGPAYLVVNGEGYPESVDAETFESKYEKLESV